MSHTFVTFLGRGQQDKNTNEWVYREATYEFPKPASGKRPPPPKTTEFFGLALAEHIKPDRVIILGTSGSQWGVLVNKLASEGEDEEALLKLLEAEEQQTVDDKMLENFKPLMQRTVKPDKAKIVPLLIPFGKDKDEQYQILKIIAKNVPDGIVSLDLTHGFRHLGMIGFLSAFMLARIGNLEVRNLWYGALDMTPREGCKKGITPVLKLNGLDRVRSWLNALNRFYASGDYGVFVDLLTDDHVEKSTTQYLKEAAFYERTHQLRKSAKKILKFLEHSNLDNQTLEGASGMFQHSLSECLAWVKEPTISKQQARLAKQYYERRDYARAAMFAWESLIVRRCEREGNDSPNQSESEKAGIDLSNVVQGWCQQEPGDNRILYENLRGIRHLVVHGTEPEFDRVKKIVASEEELRKGLKKTFELLKYVLDNDN